MTVSSGGDDGVVSVLVEVFSVAVLVEVLAGALVVEAGFGLVVDRPADVVAVEALPHPAAAMAMRAVIATVVGVRTHVGLWLDRTSTPRSFVVGQLSRR